MQSNKALTTIQQTDLQTIEITLNNSSKMQNKNQFTNQMLELGKKIALESREVKEDPNKTKTRIEYVQNSIALLQADPYDPTNNIADKIEEEKVQNAKEELELLKTTERRLTEEETTTRTIKNEFQHDLNKPKYAPWLILAAILLLLVVFIPSFYLYILFTLEPIMRNILSTLSSLLLSIFLINFILVGATTSIEKSKLNTIGLILGTLTCTLILVRLAWSESLRELIFGIGLTSLEILVLCAVVNYSNTLRRQYGKYIEAQKHYTKWQSSKENLENCQRKKAQCLNYLENHKLSIEFRHFLSKNKQTLIDAATSAFRIGYQQGIDQNRQNAS